MIASKFKLTVNDIAPLAIPETVRVIFLSVVSFAATMSSVPAAITGVNELLLIVILVCVKIFPTPVTSNETELIV